MTSVPLLSVNDLYVRIDSQSHSVFAVNGVSWSISPGETLAIVGESGSGKSISVSALLGLLPPNSIASGSAMFAGTDLLAADEEVLNALRGLRISMIFQDPLSSLNPVMRVGDQIAEAFVVHHVLDEKAANARAVELLQRVGIPDAETRSRSYPHEFSGGMRQRVMIAMAIANNPTVLIADEPTTALDVTVQAQILELFKELKDEYQLALILITHDLGVVAGVADRVAVMYGGRLMEIAGVDELFGSPKHPYTKGLIASLPSQGHEELTPIRGNPKTWNELPPGCPFVDRCDYAIEPCRTTVPELLSLGSSMVACHVANGANTNE